MLLLACNRDGEGEAGTKELDEINVEGKQRASTNTQQNVHVGLNCC
jgi:hypothetical protein